MLKVVVKLAGEKSLYARTRILRSWTSYGSRLSVPTATRNCELVLILTVVYFSKNIVIPCMVARRPDIEEPGLKFIIPS